MVPGGGGGAFGSVYGGSMVPGAGGGIWRPSPGGWQGATFTVVEKDTGG